MLRCIAFSPIHTFPTLLVRIHSYVWRYKKNCFESCLHFFFLVFRQWTLGHNCRRISVSLFTRNTYHAKMAACQPTEDTSPPYLLFHSPGRRVSLSVSQQTPIKKGVSRQIHAKFHHLRVSNILLYDIIHSSKAITTNLYGGTYIQYGCVWSGLLVSRVLLNGDATCTLP